MPRLGPEADPQFGGLEPAMSSRIRWPIVERNPRPMGRALHPATVIACRIDGVERVIASTAAGPDPSA